MNLSVHRVTPVEWAAPRVAENAKTKWSTRSGWRITLRDTDGLLGTGVAAPLPDYAPETADEARAAVDALDLDAATNTVEGVRRQVAAVSASTPSVRFALETALLDLLSRRHHCRVLDLFETAVGEVRSAALVDTFDTMAVASAKEAGATTVKLKVGRHGRLDEELRSVEAATRLMRVRVDANGALDASAVRRFAALGVEFVEEPGEAADGSSIAWDESIRRADFEARLRIPGVVAVVLKPMVLGGVLRCLELAVRARRVGVEAIASHTFDGPIAHRANARLALLLGEGRYAHGLGGAYGYRIRPASLGDGP